MTDKYENLLGKEMKAEVDKTKKYEEDVEEQMKLATNDLVKKGLQLLLNNTGGYDTGRKLKLGNTLLKDLGEDVVLDHRRDGYYDNKTMKVVKKVVATGQGGNKDNEHLEEFVHDEVMNLSFENASLNNAED